MAQSFGWCFIGAGRIAQRVLADLPHARSAYIAAVYSRKGSSAAERFARSVGATAYEALDAALMDPFVRGVYVATPNDTHQMYTEAALRHGKPVLCEKPFALTATQARSMIALAEERGVYLMEGMWTRFNPAVIEALRWIAEGRIGRVRLMEADFAFRADLGVASRLTDLTRGGGSLLDLGVYTLALARMVMGKKPVRTEAVAGFTQTGVDAQCAMLLSFEGGAVARLYSGIEVTTPGDAVIYGEKGKILIPRFAMADSAILSTDDGTEVFDGRHEGEGFQFEFGAFMDDVRAGRTENALVTHQFTLDVMEMMDTVRERIGLYFSPDWRG